INVNDFDVELDSLGYTNHGSLGYSSGDPFDLVVLGDKLYFTASKTVPIFEGIDENGDSVPVDNSGMPLDPEYPFAIQDYTLASSYEYRGIVELDPVDNSFAFVVGQLQSQFESPTFEVEYGAGSLQVVGDQLLFLDSGSSNNGGLWTYDPITASTEQLLAQNQINSSVDLSDGQVVAFGSAIYLAYNDPATGQELYLLSESNPPTANAGGPYTGIEGSPFMLDGSASFDAETPISGLLFEWDLDYDGSTFQIDATGVQPEVVFGDDFTSRNIALRVSDPNGLNDLTVVALQVGNAPPVINGLPDATGQAGQIVTFSSSVSDPGENDLLTYSWSFGDGATQDGANLTSPVHTYTETGSFTASLQVTDDSGASVQQTFQVVIAAPVSFSVGSQTVGESAGAVTATITLDSPATSPVTLPYSVSGTADSSDHDLAGGSVSIAIGEVSAEIVVNIADDQLDEEDLETIVITLGTPVGASLGAFSAHSISIADNDSKPHVSFATPYQRVEEDFGATASVAVRLDAVSGRDVVVPLAVTGTANAGDDFTIDTTTVTIPAGQLSAAATVSLVNDVDPESAETIQFSLLASNQADVASSAGSALPHVVTIPQNDAVQAWFEFPTTLTREGNAYPGYLNVQLSKTSTSDISLPITLTGDVSDVVMAPADGVLVIPAGQLYGSVSLTAVDDAVPENRKTIVATLGTPVGAILGPVTEQVVYIYDNDVPLANISTTKSAELFESAGAIDVLVSLDKPAVVDVTFQIKGAAAGYLRATQGEDYTITNPTVTIPAGETSVSTVVQMLDDTDFEATESLHLELIVPSIQTSSFVDAVQAGENTTLDFDIRDNDPRIRISTSDRWVEEDAGTHSYQISVEGDSEGPVDVSFVTGGTATRGTDYSHAASGTLSINPGQTISRTLTVVDDSFEESRESIELTFSSSDADFLQYGDLRFDRLSFDIIDNDEPAPRVYMSLHSSTAGGFSLTDERAEVQEGGFVTAKIRLSRPSSTPVTITTGIGLGFGLTAGGSNGFQLTDVNGQNLSGGSLVLPSNELETILKIKIPEDAKRGDYEFYTGLLSASTPSQISDINDTGSLILNFDSKPIIVRDNDAPSTVNQAAVPPLLSSPTGTGNIGSTGALNIDLSGPVLPGGYTGASSPLSSSGGQFTNDQPFTLNLPIQHNGSNGFIVGATAFFDANFNGVIEFLDLNSNGLQDAGEPSEPSAITDAEGNFVGTIDAAFDLDGSGLIEETEGRWVISGGFDASKNIPLAVPISAPAGMYVINGVSTLASMLVENGGMSLDDARTRLGDAFGLSASDLGYLDNVRAASVNDQEGNRAVVANAQIMDTVVLASRMYAALPGAPSVEYFADIAFTRIAASLESDAATIDFTSDIVVKGILQSIAVDSGFSLSATDTTAAATAI
ncbi:PKD domain-containing protein, partial [Planctomycetota bacterium]